MYPYQSPQYPTPEQVPTPVYPPYTPQPVVFIQPPRQVPHLLHAILTAATCGLWSPIWIIDALRK